MNLGELGRRRELEARKNGIAAREDLLGPISPQDPESRPFPTVEDDFYTFSQLKKEPKSRREWLVKDLFTSRSINHLVGSTSSGKSVIALQIIKSIREGTEFLGFKSERRGAIVYFGLEDGKE